MRPEISSIDSLSSPEQYSNTLGAIPERWGRMDVLSQAVLIEVGNVLRNQALLTGSSHDVGEALTLGLICGSRHGSFNSDVLFSRSMTEDANLASPALFCYTLATVPLAEAAIHYNLTGPVFALISRNPYAEALQTAQEWLTTNNWLDGVISGEFDCTKQAGRQDIAIRLTFISENNRHQQKQHE